MIREPYFFCTTPSLTPQTTEEALFKEIKQFHEGWLKKKTRMGLINFSDLEVLFLNLVKSHPHVQKELQRRYQHILVDEFQDTNPLQAAIVDSISNPGLNKLFLVGDPKQSIYRFRRADVSVFGQKAKSLQKEGGQVIFLQETFRLAPKLTQIINKVFEPLFGESPETSLFEPMVAAKSDLNGNLTIVIAPKAGDTIDKMRRLEATWIGRKIKECDSNDFSQTALLFKSGAPMLVYWEELTKMGIPCQINKSHELLKVPVIRDLIHIINYLAGDTGAITKTGILRSPLFGFSEQFVEHFIRSEAPSFLSGYTPSLFQEPSDRVKWEMLTKLIGEWSNLKVFLPPTQLVSKIVSDLGFGNATELPFTGLRHIDANEGVRLLLEQWIELLCDMEFEGQNPLYQMSQFLKLLQKSDDGWESLTPPKIENAIHLMTIHGSKGLEFKRVFLPQLYATERSHPQDFYLSTTEGLLLKKESLKTVRGLKSDLEEPPLFTELKDKDAWEEREESKRLLYVAMTRVKEDLYLFLKEPTQKRIKLSETKRWNDWLWILLEQERTEALPLIQDANTQAHRFDSLANRLSEAFTSDEKSKPSKPVAERQNILLPVTKPTLPVSVFEVFSRCEKEFQLKYEFAIEAVSEAHSNLPASQWGTLMHEIWQFLDFTNYHNQDTVMAQAFFNQKLNPQEHTSKVVQVIDGIKRHPQLHSLLNDGERSKTELPFLLDMDSFFLQGVIDRLTFYKGFWTIIDFKTDKISSDKIITQKEKLYEFQMGCYALAVNKITGASHVRTALVFTDGPYLNVKDWTLSDISEFAGKIQNIFSQLTDKKTKKQFDYPINLSRCPQCPYWPMDYCGVRGKSGDNFN